MIKNIIDLLQIDDFYGISSEIDFAKGMYDIPYNWKDGFSSIKRIWKSKR